MNKLFTIILLVFSSIAFAEETKKSFIEVLTENINLPKRKLTREPSAVPSSDHLISVGVGQNFMFSDYSSHIDDNFNLTLGYQYYNKELINVRIDLDYNSSDENYIFGVKPNFAYKLITKDKLRVEPTLGLAFYNVNIDKSDIVFGFTFGMRVSLALNEQYETFFSTTYNNPFESDTNPDGSYQNLGLGINYIF